VTADELPGRLRVLVADDHAPTRAGVRGALAQDGFDVVAECSTAPEAVRLARETRPDVCVLDVHMPGSGVSAAEAICREVPDAAVVMLTYSQSDDDLLDAVRAGARGYLVKDMDPDRLGAALRGVLDGEAALPRNLVARLMTELRTGNGQAPVVPERRGRDRRTAALSGRELQVLQMLADGATTGQIARRLFLSEGTVRVHVSNLLKKLGVGDREAAVRVLREES
jgi:two-component system, NarL family, nitrate/nitrite response regulator NarL